ncbi:MAG: bifunctional transaldolase/phosoglucose isomerase [Acidobacteriia bacterium]|nr:bifunctional transaldolase/phosoglucose isomerase [Terriglobia bacterium]
MTPASTANPLRALGQYGQSVWLDFIRRSLITSGELQRLIREDGLRGVTSNPAIFEKAIAGSSDYKDVLEDPASRNLDAKALYEQIAIRDIQAAANALAPVYEASLARDGYVSLEVSPALARDTAGTLEEARRLWSTVARKNLMVKVPGTAEGIPALQQLITEGINVNVTLLFSQAVYEQVAEAYIAGLEARAAQGKNLSHVASVASFFVSRIDTAIDSLPAAKQAGLAGKVAIANAKLTYERSNQILSGSRWAALRAKGAQKQRLLWASTSTKNPSYRDVMYVEELIGPDTVNTIPPATFDAFRDHGRPRASLSEDVEAAHRTMDALAKAGISMKEVTAKLLEEGLQQFQTAFDALLKATGKASVKINRQSFKIPDDLAAEVQASLADWKANDKVHRLWRGDASLWSVTDESQWVGWLGIVDDQLAHAPHLKSIAEEVKLAGFQHALLLGMGGSSLCPEVMRMTFGKVPGFPEMHVLDSTDPAQILATQKKIDLANTIFIVSSKSGGTLEPNIFKQYFFERVKQAVGAEEAPQRFIAITDPGSKMQRVATTDHFRHTFFGLPSIGGRYSALSDFGMVPAAIMGVDVPRFLDMTEEMVQACTPTVPVEENPGLVLGTVLGVLAKHGRDKVTLVSSPGIHDLGAWLEQLLAESTGKIGKGMIPVDRENPGSPAVYGKDRVFAYLRLESAPDAAQDQAVDALERAGQPVIRISVGEPYNLGEEFFRWEIATAVAGSILGINPFNQPDVEASKIATRKLTDEYEQTGHLAPESPILEADGIKLFADERNGADLSGHAGGDRSLSGYLKAHLGRLSAGDYFALLGYIEMNDAHESALQSIRHTVRDARRVATCLGFGPRFLHSTGQAYKGGPNSGVFLQITCDDAVDLPVPGQTYTFGVVKAAQARGDFQVLADRGRRALRVHLGADVDAGLRQLADLVKGAL